MGGRRDYRSRWTARALLGAVTGTCLVMAGCSSTASDPQTDCPGRQAGTGACEFTGVPQPVDGLVMPPPPAEQPDVAAAGLTATGQVRKPRSGAKPPAGKRVVGYYPNYKMYNGYEPGRIPFDQLTDVNYAFAFIANGSGYYTSTKYYPQGLPETGGCAPSDWWGDKQKELTVDGQKFAGGFAALNQGGKAVNPNLKTFLSVGGYQQIVGLDGDTRVLGEVPWSLVTSNEAAMDKFVKSCVNLINSNGFDGIDLDWEFPTGADTADYVKLLQKFRKALGQAPLTVAGPPDAARIASQGGERANRSVDWVNIMAYDYFGAWGGFKTDSNAPLTADRVDPNPGADVLNVAATISAYEAAGFSANKLVLGTPFYGRSFAGVSASNNGLFQSFTGPGKHNGAPTYRQIEADNAGYRTYQQSQQQVPYAYNAETKSWISYDDAESIGRKAQFATSGGLRGAMIWELSGDTDDHTLLNSLNTNLG